MQIAQGQYMTQIRMLLTIIDLLHCISDTGGLLGKEWIQAVSASY